MRRSLILTLLLALSLPVATMAQSGLRTEGDVATASGAYEAEVPVNSQAEADRNGALARALSVVLGKLSGDRNVMSRPGVVQALRNAKDYGASYDYKQDQSVGASGAPSFRTLLVARFREDDVDSLVSALGLPVDHDYMSFDEAEWEGRPLTVCRTGYTGERGYELVSRWEDALALWDALLEAAAPYEGLPCGLGARDTLRTEMGYPLHGQDLSLEITPVQARAGWAVGWKKDSFWGKDALTKEKAEGPRRISRGLKLTGRGIPRAHCVVRSTEGEELGEVTSGTFSPTLGQGVALALMLPDVAEGDTVAVDVRGRLLEAVVTKPPFVEVQTRSN